MPSADVAAAPRSSVHPTAAPGSLSALLVELVRCPAGAGWSSPAVPGERIGRFEILREIGRGGFGVVYAAQDHELQRQVAFKAVRPSGVDPFRDARLLGEAEAAARLSHPNIVHLYDVGRCERGAYLVLELLRGVRLADRLAAGALPLREAVRIAVEVSRGLAHAHALGVVHRDLTPGNVFLCDDGQVKILDFGLARVLGREAPSGGTPSHMSPEQARGEPGDARSDVFSLGVLLHRAIAGRLPFPPQAEPEDRYAAPAPPLKGAPAPLARVVARMLSAEPSGRPVDGHAVHDELLRIQRQLEPRPRLWLAWAVTAATLLAATGLAMRGRPAALPPGRLLVALADTENATGEGALDDLSPLLATALEPSPRLSILARSRLLSLRESRQGTRLTGSGARDAARRARAHAVLLLAVRQAADGYALELRAVDLGHDEPLFTLRERASGRITVPDALDRLAERARAEVGDRAPSTVRLARAVSGEPEAWRRYAEGLRLESEGRADQARESFEHSLRADPAFPLAHLKLAGRLLWRDWDEVRRHLDAARRGLDRLPPRERVLFDARAAAMKFRHEDAMAAYDRAIAGWPQDPTAYLEAGTLLQDALYDPAQARPYLEKALELGGLDARERHWAEIALGRLDEALEHARAGAQASPSRLTLTRLSQVHRLRGEQGEALDAARRAIAGDPRPLLRAWRTGDPQGAVRGLQAMSGAEPTYMRGVILAELGRDREAVEAFRSFRRAPDEDDNFDGGNVYAYPHTLYLEAVSLDRLGDRDGARRVLDRLLGMWRQADPDLPLLRSAKALRRRLQAERG